jgi:hypothetical protein
MSISRWKKSVVSGSLVLILYANPILPQTDGAESENKKEASEEISALM